MTRQETERLAKMEQKQDDMSAKIDALIQKFDDWQEKADNKYLTRIEGRAVAFFISLAIAVISLYYSFKK